MLQDNQIHDYSKLTSSQASTTSSSSSSKSDSDGFPVGPCSAVIKRLERFNRINSTASTLTVNTEALFNDKSWLDDPAAWDHFCSVLTSLYALFIIVFAVVVELSQKFTPDEWFSETLFYTYMYGAGIVFLVYCYLFKVYPSWFNSLLKFADKHRWINGVSSWYIVKTSHTGEGAGSLYLRLGTLCFGSSGIVLFCLEIFMCISDRRCFTYQLVNWVFAGFFTFIQMHFIFCNSKDFNDDSLENTSTASLLNKFITSNDINDNILNNFTIALEKIEHAAPLKVSSFDYFGDFATLLTTSIVEYSVIGAAIMIVLWRSIDENSERAALIANGVGGQLGKCNKRKNKVRIDCSASSGGLFAGLLFMICAFVSIGIHSFFSQHCDSHGALLVFRLSDMALFCFTLIGCSIAIYRMRILQYHQQRSSSAEFLDEILLVIGLIGELIHSSTGVMCWISTQSERVPMEFYMLFVFITRIVQVVVQAVFILLARRSFNKPIIFLLYIIFWVKTFKFFLDYL